MTAAGRDAGRGRLLFVAANPSIDRLYEVDRLEIGGIHRPTAVVAVPGGKGLNAARAAATLGGAVTVAAIVGGRAGDWIVERLEELGVTARFARAGGETRTCTSVLDRSTGTLTEIYERRTALEPAAWDALEGIVRAELERGDLAAVAVSGSLPPGAPADGFARIARIAAAGPEPALVLADTYGPALTALLPERPAILKLNVTEAAESSGVMVADGDSALGAARRLRDRGAASVVITLGRDGAVVDGPDGLGRLVPPHLPGLYSVGSGDAFLGGLAVAVGRGERLLEAARFGLAAGIANAQVPGAGLLEASLVGELARQVTVATD